MFSEVENYVLELCEKKKLPLIDVLVMKDNKELYRFYTGYDKAPTGKEDLCLFSCTKPVTVVAAMQLCEAGVIALDDPVEKYIPAFGDAFLIDEKGEKRPPKTPITIRHLFTMSAGIDYNRETPEIRSVRENMGKTATTADVMAAKVKEPLHFDPGTSFTYSLCHDVLGAVIEVATGKSLNE